MTPAIRRAILAPALLAAVGTLALLAPGAVGATGRQPAPAVSATGSTGASGPSGPAPVLTASVGSCHADAAQQNRYAIFDAQMTSVAGTRTMAVNFELLERSGGSGAGDFTVVAAPGFGVWVASQPGVGIYTYDHEVTGLPAPAAFRVLVRARWFDRRHQVIRREELLSPACVEPLDARRSGRRG